MGMAASARDLSVLANNISQPKQRSCNGLVAVAQRLVDLA